MPPRFRSSFGLALLLLVVYLVLTRDEVNFGNPVPPIDLTDPGIEPQPTPIDKGLDVVWISGLPHTQMPAEDPSNPTPVIDEDGPTWTGTKSSLSALLETTASQTAEEPLPAKEINFAPEDGTEPWDTDVTQPLHQQYKEEYARLGKQDSAGKIFGNTLSNMVNTGAHAGFKATALMKAGKHLDFTDQEPLIYNPYPDYTGDHYKMYNQGDFVDCAGPGTGIADVQVFSGHSKIFAYPQMGAYSVLDIDSNLCFERETRLGPYGFIEPGSTSSPPRNWDVVDWGQLQESCATKNSGRYNVAIATLSTLHTGAEWGPHGNSTPKEKRRQDMALLEPSTIRKDAKATRAFEKESHHREPRVKARDEHLHGMATHFQQVKAHSRTAVLLRANSARVWTENDKQNIRAMVTELSLLTGGEYQVFILFQVLDNSKPIFSDPSIYSATLRTTVPQEFWSMTVLYNELIFEDLYTKIPPGHHNSRDSHWFPVQKFALDYPGFDYYWNWNLDSRYTGHYYTLLEKVGEFSDMQPRKGLWERNERYYIPDLHGAYASQFRFKVELRYAGALTQWGAAQITSVDALGPNPPVENPKADNYEWGLHEKADFISLAPIFNPVATDWARKNDVWGYNGPEATPRRGTHTLQSRLSKKLLQIMHAENVAGNHIGSEMAPATVSLLHGLKAVYAPHPIFMDREWKGRSLNRWFNPGPHDESGSTHESPFSAGRTERFQGMTWGTNSEVAKKMYNHWLGSEDGGIGGQEWEKENGRTCLPPILLYPIKDVKMPALATSPASQ